MARPVESLDNGGESSKKYFLRARQAVVDLLANRINLICL